jgi:hypothetical protein
MQHGYTMVREAVKQFPLPLSVLTDKKLISYADSLLPYSTGFEIECELKSSNWDTVKQFTRIPNIMDFNTTPQEQKFRIPAGIKGLICLYEICSKLKEYATLNPASGIHYHIDFTDCFNRIDSTFISKNNNWVINSLQSWRYTGKFNEITCSTRKTAVKYHSGYKTLEFRIGEMSFDYELLVKRIIHCQNISKKLKVSLKSPKGTKLPKVVLIDNTLPRVIGRIEL